MKENKYTVLILNWPVKGSYKIVAFKDFFSAQKMAKEFALEHEYMANSIIVIEGNIVKLGVY